MTPAQHERILQVASWNAVCFLVCFVAALIEHFWSYFQ